MTGTQVLALEIQAGDVIHICHHHDAKLGRCLVGERQTDVVVVGKPRRVHGRVAVDWDESASLLGCRPEICGCAVYEPNDYVLRIGHLAVAA